MVTVGLRTVQQMTMGKCIGKQDLQGLFMFLNASIIMTVTYSIFIIVIFTAFEYQIFYLFTNPGSSVITELEAVWNVFYYFIIFDSLQMMLSSLVSVSGKPGIGAIASWIAYPFLGFGCIYYNVVVRGVGLPGVWSGATFTVIVMTLVFAVYYFVEDWEKVSADAV